jgi:hypothetical protein
MNLREHINYYQNEKYKANESNFTPYQPYDGNYMLKTQDEKKKKDKPMQTYLSIFDKGRLYGF